MNTSSLEPVLDYVERRVKPKLEEVDIGGTETDFLPHETGENQDFEPVDVTINQKSVLSTIYPLDERTDELYEKMGFGHVDNVETMM